MSWFAKKTQDTVRLTWAQQHSAWDPLRADLEVPRVPAAPSLRSAAADFVAGLESDLRDAERELALAGEAVRQAVVTFAAFDSAHRLEPGQRDADLPPPLVRTTRRIAAHFKDGKETI
jgi:hypothetical protein